MSLYAILGEVFFLLVIITPVLLLIAMILGAIFMMSDRTLFPRFSYTILTVLFQPARSLLILLKIDPLILNEILIALINSFTRDEYSRSPKERRILFLPQCLRSLECPAKTSVEEGIVCLECGRCEIADIVDFCRGLGIRVYIVPGGGFVRRIIRSRMPDAVAGVACPIELYDMMRSLVRAGVPAQGVILAKSGCIETIVDWDEVKRIVSG